MRGGPGRFKRDDEGSNPARGPSLADIIDAKISRRALLGGLAGAAAGSALGGIGMIGVAHAAPSSLTFAEAAHEIADDHSVAAGYRADVLIRWGDPVLPDAPAFEPGKASPAAQERQFGYNNDYVGFFPLPVGSSNANHGLLVVNHEYTNPELMFPGITEANAATTLTREQCETEMAAHGLSVVEVKKVDGRWRVIEGGRFARRLSFRSTPMAVSGPAAGHPRMRTAADPTGKAVIGTLNNCAGGKTPWGTVLTAEENFHQYFAGDPTKTAEAANLKRVGITGKPNYPWGRHFDRMNVEKEPNEPNRFGWIVEFDPYDPTSLPVKRTALGRFKHEAATVVINPNGRVTVYTGDDERFEYLYRFVSSGRFDPADRAANKTLLDDGVLYVAKFTGSGAVKWIPMVWGEGLLTPSNGFAAQADVLIDCRRAADMLGATKLDRPEDVETNPVTGKVYMMLTNNTNRQPNQVDAPNPRAKNAFGHVIEMVPPGEGAKRDHTASEYAWNVFLLAGDPGKPEHGARYHAETSGSGWLAAPDNCAFDRKGRLWISTDQGSAQAKNGIPDGMYACDTEGAGRALTRFFYACPRAAEMCGPEFTPDGTTLFVAVQHPAESEGSTFDKPATRWPDFKDGMPPRPAIVAITRADGGEIGS
ncbi:MAG: PhoX family phosphatase [Alphaproteobacteria bacterium]|nr:PhoX family phosphatase [Alphaproteobacteria bacterium]